MKLLAINESIYGSTGKLMEMICKSSGMDYMLAVSNSRSNRKYHKERCVYIGTRISRNLHLMFGRCFGLNGRLSILATIRLIKIIKKFHPDIIHLHNLHNCYINLPLLFRFLSQTDAKLIWTLHDCWPFTGHCPHFVSVQCDKWKEGCYQCALYRDYPRSLIDDSRKMWRLKKKWFNLPSKIQFVAPSFWLKSHFENSFLKKYECVVIHNGIDLGVFKYSESDYRSRLGVPPDDYIVLGVAQEWTRKKGIDVFTDLRLLLGQKYHIVLVGRINSSFVLPDNVINIKSLDSQQELARVYSAADVFVNPTREDTFPTVNMEARACSLRVVAFNVGGCKETLSQNDYLVACNDVAAMAKCIESVCQDANGARLSQSTKENDIGMCVESYLRLYDGER